MRNKNHIIDLVLDAEKAAKDFGFIWSSEEKIINQMISECLEIREVIKNKESKKRLQEEIGDLIAASFSLCTFAGLDIVDTIEQNIQKFKIRLDLVKKITLKHGMKDLKGQSDDVKIDIWNEVKKHENL